MSDLITTESMGFLERVVRDPSIDVVKLEQIIALQERVAAREAKRQFAEAMNALQREMPQVTKDAVSQNRRYATYEAVDAVIRPHYTKFGFSVSFTLHAANNRIRVGCRVKHRGGHEETEHELESGPDMSGARGQATKTEVQGVGSVTTYLKRYTIMAAFAVALQDDADDDDGESARKDQQAARTYPPRDARDALNASVPLAEAPAKMTWTQLLDSIEIALKDETAIGIDRILASSQVKEAQAHAKGEALRRLDRIVFAAEQRRNAMDDTAEAEVDEGDWPAEPEKEAAHV
jgi:hypothetical protein